jgi:hypothetical protein
VKKCDDCECGKVCVRWVADNETAEPAAPAACGAFLSGVIDGSANDPYFNDRPYPIESEFAGGANPYARENPDAPWVWRGLPHRSGATGDVAFIGHELTAHGFPVPDVATRARTRRHIRVERPERKDAGHLVLGWS